MEEEFAIYSPFSNNKASEVTIEDRLVAYVQTRVQKHLHDGNDETWIARATIKAFSTYFPSFSLTCNQLCLSLITRPANRNNCLAPFDYMCLCMTAVYCCSKKVSYQVLTDGATYTFWG